MKLILVRQTWSHMASVSGFDPLFNIIQKKYGRSAISFHVPLRYSKINRLISKVLNITNPYASSSAHAGIPDLSQRHDHILSKILRFAKKNKQALILLSVGEEQYSQHFINAPASIRNRIVLFMHMPPSWYKLHWQDFNILNGLRAIVCLSSEQAYFLKGVCDTTVLLIRHGVNHDFFRPEHGGHLDGNPRLIYVGHWLRDHDTFFKTMQIIWRTKPNIMVDWVLPYDVRWFEPVRFIPMARDDRISWHANLSADELKELYCRATLLLLPLLDSTANNALVEAFACGIPVISSIVGGIFDYIPEGLELLASPGDAQAHADLVFELLQDENKREAIARRCRSFAETKLDWEYNASHLLNNLFNE